MGSRSLATAASSVSSSYLLPTVAAPDDDEARRKAAELEVRPDSTVSEPGSLTRSCQASLRKAQEELEAVRVWARARGRAGSLTGRAGCSAQGGPGG